MSKFIILRLHPVEPTTAAEFTTYLKGLTITAFDASFKNLEGREIRETDYVPVKDSSGADQPTKPYLRTGETRIWQHLKPVSGPAPAIPATETEPEQPAQPGQYSAWAVATAVIEIDESMLPPGGVEYLSSDLVLKIERDKREVADGKIEYNVAILETGALRIPPIPQQDQGVFDYWLDVWSFYQNPPPEPVAAYVPLPPPGAEDPSIARVKLPEDGGPPQFDPLKQAVEIVLRADPKVNDQDLLSKLKSLTAVQCRHVASEIIWNRKIHPLPGSKFWLEGIYTADKAGADPRREDRMQFEAGLRSYYAIHSAEADRLSRYIFSLSAAIYCEHKTTLAERVGFQFPICPGFQGQPARITEASVVLVNEDASGNPADLNLDFIVPAQYFYALGVSMPLQVSGDQRYEIACLEPEARILTELEDAVKSRIIDIGHHKVTVSPQQAARRLRSLGVIAGTAPECRVESDTPVQKLVASWLDYKESDPVNFWATVTADEAMGKGHLALVLAVITDGHDPLIKAIEASYISSVSDLAAFTSETWHGLLLTPSENGEEPPPLLPPSTAPGSDEARAAAFIRHVRNFFDVAASPGDPGELHGDVPPDFGVPSSDPVKSFIAAYETTGDHSPFTFGAAWDSNRVDGALEIVFPEDPSARSWLKQALEAINDLSRLAEIGEPGLKFSIMEALYARGFTSLKSVSDLPMEDFRRALTGTVAYDHAERIHQNAGEGQVAVKPEKKQFQPVNPDGSLTNCIPPPHLSPLGPVAYLNEMLKVTPASTCEHPFPDGGENANDFGALIEKRRGPLGELHVTRANLETPMPLIDLVNECLEALAGQVTEPPAGVVYDTSATELEGHKLQSMCSKGNPDGNQTSFEHDPGTLFAAMPEHSSPATPVRQDDAYLELQSDFSSPILPYSQPLDVSRSYLKQLGTSRYAAMRRFRKDVTEFVLDPSDEPKGFQSHLWRYPVRMEIAFEYLGITPEEYDVLFTPRILDGHDKTAREILLMELYGFHPDTTAHGSFGEIVVRVSEFLKRTGLTYCEFLELQKAKYVIFGAGESGEAFPDCEPCRLDDYQIVFVRPSDPEEAIKRLAVFIRLWRKLQEVKQARYTFAELGDICEVLQLFGADGKVNRDFVRQLAAFQILRDHFALVLTDGSVGSSSAASDSERTHLLALWAGSRVSKWSWAVDHLLEQIHHYAYARHDCDQRPPEFIKVMKENLDPLSRLTGFNPDAPGQSWHDLPTHTLRFAEILAKIYASEFGVGEIFFLFTTNEHLDGDDPFPLQSDNETLDSPLGLPDDERDYSLLALRRKLLATDVSDKEAAAWTWPRIEASLRDEFSFPAPAAADDPILSLGMHFFPTVLETWGTKVDPRDRQYRVSLTKTPAAMWNTPSEGPFGFDLHSNELWTQLPLTDEAVIGKLSRIRQLNDVEQTAVKELYFLPREELARFAFIFASLAEADKRLIQETDETRRWTYFRREFVLCRQRCLAIADHVAGHVTAATGKGGAPETGLAWRLLQSLLADENRAKIPWEADDGTGPAETWNPRCSGGAFAALLGLMGTGLIGEFIPVGSKSAWREIRGPMDPFGSEENAWNSPIPTIVPSIGLSREQERFVAVRNGFAIRDEDGTALGGAQGFSVRWSGTLLVETEGTYEFRAGAPTPEGEEPDFEAAEPRCWRATIKRGQKTWILLSHNWPNEQEFAARSAKLPLKSGAYQLIVEFTQPQPTFLRPQELRPQATGFQLKYTGPDSEDRLVTIPLNKLFRDQKDTTTGEGIESVSGAAKRFLELYYTSSLRDIRRTYQRAFKAMLFTHRFGLLAKPVADDGQSEIGYMLGHTDEFAGRSYYRNDHGKFISHAANFDFNFLPVSDNYHSPAPGQDQRSGPSVKRQQALFDWWERVFDYTTIRREAQTAPERPVWLLFHEAAEQHPDDPVHLLRHMGVDLRHSALVLRYYAGMKNEVYPVSSTGLEDERWALRAWFAEKWIRDLASHFAAQDIRDTRLDLWASDDPSIKVSGEGKTGNEDLTSFFRKGCIENGDPRRYEDVRRLNDGLRDRARGALLAYLCGMNRIQLPWGGHACKPGDLSDLLLLDVQVGVCEKASRIEEAIGAVQEFVQRLRLGLEPKMDAHKEFIHLWDRRFATFQAWEACKRREIYCEDWVEWNELEKARRSESFRFLEDQLRHATLTVPVSGGSNYRPNLEPPIPSGLRLLQDRTPALIDQLDSSREGFDLLATPETSASPSWLAALGRDLNEAHHLPLWIQSAVRLGTKFVRVAAAGRPPGFAHFEERPSERASACCVECDEPHPPVLDEYYFWLMDSRYYHEVEQDAEWSTTKDRAESDWHKPEKLPRLLHWNSKPMVHLAWCRVHNGRFLQPGRSHEGVRVREDATPNLAFTGRSGDSLTFEVDAGEALPGYSATPTTPGFRYDLATDSAVVLPLVISPDGKKETYPRGLSAYPYFVYFVPGAPVKPPSLFSPALSVAGWLRAHCRFEAALKWYELAFNPLHEDCRWAQSSEEMTAHRAVILHYLETLFDWGEARVQRNSPEAFQQARLIFDTASRILGAIPHSVLESDPAEKPAKVEEFGSASRFAPLNPRLMTLYARARDRLGLVHACLNASRLRNGRVNEDMPFWGSALLHGDLTANKLTCQSRRAFKPVCPDEDWCCPQSPYRFSFLVQKSQELAGEVRSLGAALLAAFEKGDAEYVAALRAGHELQLLNLALDVRQNQWREADWQVQALGKTKEAAETRRRYYERLIQNGLNSGESQYEVLTAASMGFRTASNVSEAIAQATGISPDGFVGFPCSFSWIPSGTKLGGYFSLAARISNTLAEIAGANASLSLTQAGWARREEEWRHQVEVLDIEIEQMERQILAAERRRAVALRELNNHRRQMEHSAEVRDFLRDKFTNHDLYLWLQQETAALHRQMYELALHTARQAERAFNDERCLATAGRFVEPEGWNDLREGLQAGERLQLGIRRMEKAYLDENVREYELTKHVSLRLHSPREFLRLKATGACEIEIPEWIFDLDYPGHYMRRIKNVTLTIPCVVGPYTGVHCRLSLLSSVTRVDPRLSVPPTSSCKCGPPRNGYVALPDDPRVVPKYLATEAIATSSGQNDAGMFELNFRDERYLPFEFSGAVSRWRIELPPENNQFDMETLSDVVIHLNYTAREGGDVLRYAANEVAQQYLTGAGLRLFDLKHEFPDAWQRFQGDTAQGTSEGRLSLRFERNMFPYIPGSRGLQVIRLELFFEAPSAQTLAQHVVELRGKAVAHIHEVSCECETRNINCVASVDWPCLYHGVLDLESEQLGRMGYSDFGTLRFPSGLGEISRAFLLCGYQVT